MKEEVVWPNEFSSHAEALAALSAWVDEYNRERPHMSLAYRTTADVSSAAFDPTLSAG